MADSEVKFVREVIVPGGAVSCFTDMQTQAVQKCRVTKEKLL